MYVCMYVCMYIHLYQVKISTVFSYNYAMIDYACVYRNLIKKALARQSKARRSEEAT